MTLGVAVVGAGAIGSRRAKHAAAQCRLEVVADVDKARASRLADSYGSRYTVKWEDAVTDPRVDAVVVCTTNKFLAPITIAALESGKHVLCEKPMGRNAAEALQMASAARSAGRILKLGFTLRFHTAIRQAQALCASGELGPLFFIQASYGHGGRQGYDKEWRGDPELAGGGELLDQGVHLLDLSRWFLGDLNVVAAATPRWHWEVAPLEDNAFVLLEASGGQLASLHTSWTMWKNRFSFEVMCRAGYVKVSGLGGSYGAESLTIGQVGSEGSVPHETVTTFSEPDPSWQADWSDFVAAIEDDHAPEVDALAGLAVMKLVDNVYTHASRTSQVPPLASSR